MSGIRLLLLSVVLCGSPLLAVEEELGLAPLQADPNPQPELTIENWIPKGSTPVARPQEAASSEEDHAPAPVPADLPTLPEPSAPVELLPLDDAKPRRTGTAMNQMSGTIVSVDPGGRIIRLEVEGGITPQFDYNDSTVIETYGHPLTVDDLRPGDKTVIHYEGKNMTARVVEKLNTNP